MLHALLIGCILNYFVMFRITKWYKLFIQCSTDKLFVFRLE